MVVQAHQAEKETIQTRTFTNYNHAHTLTVLYHEVLRHFRVTTKWIRRRRAVLVPRVDYAWSTTSVRKHRTILAALLDSQAKPGFDALERLLVMETDDTYNPHPAPAITQPRNWRFSAFEFTVTAAEDLSEGSVYAGARLVSAVATVPMRGGGW